MGYSHDSINLEDRWDRELQLQFLRFAQHPVHAVASYFFRMVHAQTREELGNINLRVGMVERELGTKRGQVIHLRNCVIGEPLAQIIGQALRLSRIPGIGKGKRHRVIQIFSACACPCDFGPQFRFARTAK